MSQIEVFTTKTLSDRMCDAVIFDIDGTLADCEHRRHHVAGKKKNFDAFYSAMAADGLHGDIANLLQMYRARGFVIILCTGRPEQYRAITEHWLERYKIHFDELLMRPDDRRHEPDYQIKQDALDILETVYTIHLAFDDRDQVVKMWRASGIRCLQVADGNF